MHLAKFAYSVVPLPSLTDKKTGTYYVQRHREALLRTDSCRSIRKHSNYGNRRHDLPARPSRSAQESEHGGSAVSLHQRRQRHATITTIQARPPSEVFRSRQDGLHRSACIHARHYGIVIDRRIRLPFPGWRAALAFAELASPAVMRCSCMPMQCHAWLN